MPPSIAQRVRRCLLAGAAAACLLASAAATAAPAAQAGEFLLGIQDARGGLTADQRAASATTMKALGAGVTRITLRWDQVAAGCSRYATRTASLSNHKNRCYRWVDADAAIANAHNHGLRTIVSLYGVPSWLLGNADPAYTGDTDDQFLKVRDAFGSFAHAVATRYGPTAAPTTGAVEYWTIWNEPNSSSFWKPAAEEMPNRYAKLFLAGAYELKTVSPASLVAAGPTAPSPVAMKPVTFIRAVAPLLDTLGAAPYLDAWAHNPYPPGKASPFERFSASPMLRIDNLPDLFSVLDERASTRGKPVWATEFAYQTNPPDPQAGVTPDQQALWLAQAEDIAWTSGRMPIFEWYVLQDPGTDPAADWDSGLYYSDGSPKPSAEMYRRPVSVSTTPDGRFRIWGKSNVDAASATIVMARNGGSDGWTVLGGDNFDSGVRVWSGDLPAGVVVAVQDSQGRGPAIDPRSGLVDSSHAKQLQVSQLITTRRKTVPARCGARVRSACRYTRVSPRLRLTLRPQIQAHAVLTVERQVKRAWKHALQRHSQINIHGLGVVTLRGTRLAPGVYRTRATSGTRRNPIVSAWQYFAVR